MKLEQNGAASVGVEESHRQFLSFKVAGESYGLPIDSVREILEFTGCTMMPMAPPFVKGVINLRGHVVPVIDVRRMFSGLESEITRWSCVIIVESGVGDEHAFTGMLVDAVQQVLELAPQDMEEAPAFGLGLSSRFVSAVGKSDEGLTVILNLSVFLEYRGDSSVHPE